MRALRDLVLLSALLFALPSLAARVAVVGAGPAGATAAHQLLQLGDRVMVFDPRPEGPDARQVMVDSHPWSVMTSFAPKLKLHASPIAFHTLQGPNRRALVARASSLEPTFVHPDSIWDLSQYRGSLVLGGHRDFTSLISLTDLKRELQAALPKGILQKSKIVDVRESGNQVHVRLDNGKTLDFDYVLLTTGAGSARDGSDGHEPGLLHRLGFGNQTTTSIPLSLAIYDNRSEVPGTAVLGIARLMLAGKRDFIVSSGRSGGSLQGLRQVAAEFGVHAEPKQVVEFAGVGRQASEFVRGRIVLEGDAAASLSPFQGAGTGLAALGGVRAATLIHHMDPLGGPQSEGAKFLAAQFADSKRRTMESLNGFERTIALGTQLPSVGSTLDGISTTYAHRVITGKPIVGAVEASAKLYIAALRGGLKLTSTLLGGGR